VDASVVTTLTISSVRESAYSADAVCAPSILHPTPYTLHPAPYTLHPTPYTQPPRCRKPSSLKQECVVVNTTHLECPLPDWDYGSGEMLVEIAEGIQGGGPAAFDGPVGGDRLELLAWWAVKNASAGPAAGGTRVEVSRS